MPKIPLHYSFRFEIHELWSKEGLGIKLEIRLPTMYPLRVGVKSFPIGVYNTWLKKYFWGLYNIGLTYSKKAQIEEDTSTQRFGIVKVSILGSGSLGKKCHLDVALMKRQNYTIGRGIVPPFKGCRLCKVYA
jgi:hypothetical protein